jgi:hypothetical protein
MFDGEGALVGLVVVAEGEQVQQLDRALAVAQMPASGQSARVGPEAARERELRPCPREPGVQLPYPVRDVKHPVLGRHTGRETHLLEVCPGGAVGEQHPPIG